MQDINGSFHCSPISSLPLCGTPNSGCIVGGSAPLPAVQKWGPGMGHAVLSQGIVMSVSPSIRLSEVLSPPQQRVSAPPQSLPSQSCSCGFSSVEPEVIWRWLPARGNLFNLEWDALGCVKHNLPTKAKEVLHLYIFLFTSVATSFHSDFLSFTLINLKT